MKNEACGVELCNGQNHVRQKVNGYIIENKQYAPRSRADVKDNRKSIDFQLSRVSGAARDKCPPRTRLLPKESLGSRGPTVKSIDT